MMWVGPMDASMAVHLVDCSVVSLVASTDGMWVDRMDTSTDACSAARSVERLVDGMGVMWVAGKDKH